MNLILRNIFLRTNSNLISFAVGLETSSSFYIYNFLRRISWISETRNLVIIFDVWSILQFLPLHPSLTDIQYNTWEKTSFECSSFYPVQPHTRSDVNQILISPSNINYKLHILASPITVHREYAGVWLQTAKEVTNTSVLILLSSVSQTEY